jgi:hypothetical protein
VDHGVPAQREPEPRPKSTRPEVEREHDVAAFVGVTVQAFWRLPENEQNIWRARFDREQSKCPHCGNQREDCADPDKTWYPQLTVCYATRERMAAHARFEQLHQEKPYHDGAWGGWAKNPSEDAPYHFLQGATVWVAQADFGQGGDFLRQKSDDDELSTT